MNFATPIHAVDDSSSDQAIEVPSVLIRLDEQVDIPAREPGLLTRLDVREGDLVTMGQPLAQVDDADAQLIRRRVQLELELGRQKNDNDVAVRVATKSLEVARAELKRAEAAEATYPKSVSDSELDFLRHTVERSELEIEQARHELDLSIAALKLKENDIQQADNLIARLKIISPITGMVAEVAKHRGEWVEPGMKVLRVLRLDRVRAEGFISASQLGGDLQGRPVTLAVEGDGLPKRTYAGRLVFVDPEIDPVNQQVRVWAEIDNKRMQLRPGMRGRMTIEPRATPDVADAK